MRIFYKLSAGMCLSFIIALMSLNIVNATATDAKETLHKRAESIKTYDQPTDGDLVCAGEKIIINAPVKGDVLCVGSKIILNTQVDGDVRIAAGSIEFTENAKVGINASLLAQTILFNEKSSIGRDLAIGAEEVKLSGIINRNVQIYAKNADLYKISIDGNANIQAQSFTLSTDSKIFNDLIYSAINKNVNQHSVAGKIIEEPYKDNSGKFKDSAKKIGKLAAIISTLGTFIFLVLIIFFKKKYLQYITMSINPIFVLTTVSIGLLALISIPVLAVIMIATGIMALVGLFILFLYVALLIMAFPVGIYYIARHFLSLAKTDFNCYVIAFIAIFMSVIISVIPGINIFYSLIAFLLGMGLVIRDLFNKKKIETETIMIDANDDHSRVSASDRSIAKKLEQAENESDINEAK